MTQDDDWSFSPEDGWVGLADFALPSEPGNERRAMELVSQVIQHLGLPERRMESVKMAVAEATLNAIEHGNGYRRDLPVQIGVWASDQTLAVTVTDQGASGTDPVAQEPDLAAKLAGEQSPRGWGLFLIKSMADTMRIREDEDRHTIALLFNLNDVSEVEAEADGA